jgi:hypothetical protein
VNHGNQHASRYGNLMRLLKLARGALGVGLFNTARMLLAQWRKEHAQAPASTRRRWKCGK